MKTRFPILAAAVLVMTWIALLLSIPSVLSLFADFKMEAFPLTIVTIWFYTFLKGLGRH